MVPMPPDLPNHVHEVDFITPNAAGKRHFLSIKFHEPEYFQLDRSG